MHKRDQNLVERLNKWNERFNLYNYFKEFLNQQQKLKDPISFQIVHEYLASKDYWWKLRGSTCYNRQRVFYSSKISPTSQLIQIYRRLFEDTISVGQIILWDCFLEYTFFQFLAKTKWNIHVFKFSQCNIDNSLPVYFMMFSTKNLEELVIKSDPISNRGISLLLKSYLPSLEILILFDTCTTSDILKVLNKKEGLYSSLGFQKTGHLNLSYYLKHLYIQMKVNQKMKNYLALKLDQLHQSPFYLGFLSKFHTHKDLSQILLGRLNGEQVLLETVPTISEKTVETLKSCFKLTFHF